MLNTYTKEKIQTIAWAIFSFYILALPLILVDFNNGRAYSDQVNFHLPTIIHFINQFDVSDYPSATTPGYHILLAIFGKNIIVNEVFFKIISSLFTAGLIGALANILYDKFGKLRTVLLLLPMIFSIYIFPAGVWLLPDNLAWLTVVAVMILSIKMPLNRLQYIYMGLLLVFAMIVRQPNLWLAATIWSVSLAYLLFGKDSNKNKIFAVLLSVIVTVPAFFIFYIFYLGWNGLVPPSFQAAHEYMSFSVPAFFLALFFVYGLFYLPIVFLSLKSFTRSYKLYWIGIGMLLGLITSLLPDTTYNVELGRSSGLWNIIKLGPTIENKSLLMMILSTLGGGMYFSFLLLVKKNLRLVILFSTLAFLLALIPNAFVYERYFSGFIFILIFIILSQTEIIKATYSQKLIWIVPLIFSILNIMVLTTGVLR